MKKIVTNIPKKTILIIILENQSKNSTETNYFNELKNECNNKKLISSLFNKNIMIYTRVVDLKNKIKKDKLIVDCSVFLYPNYIYGILDNDVKNIVTDIEPIFNKLKDSIDSCEYSKLLLPPESMTFEYFLSLHIIKNEKICLDQNQTNENLKKEFNIKDLKKIKSDKQIFFKSFQNGTELLFDNVNKHTNQHQYKEFVETIFHKPNKVKTI